MADFARRRVVWSDHAWSALDDILEFVAKDNPQAVPALLEQFLEKAEALGLFAERGRVVPEIGRDNIREVFLHRFRILYEVHEREVYIVGILHGARDFDRWVRGD